MTLMSCTSRSDSLRWISEAPISFTDLKSILSTLTSKESLKLSSSTSSDLHRRSVSRRRTKIRQLSPQNQVFGGAAVNSFLVSSSTSAIHISRQDAPEVLVPPPSSSSSPAKRYFSSFKTLIHSTNSKQTQRLNYINDSVVILKLSKERTNNDSTPNTQLSSKHSPLSTANTVMSGKTQETLSPSGLRPILKIEGQRRRTVHHESPIIALSAADTSSASNQMATSTSNHLPPNPSAFTYRSAAASGNTVRQRVIPETPPNNLLISAERYKSNISASTRPTRQPSMTTTYLSSQQTQRNMNPTTKSRVQLEKLTHSRESYAYADPFTNCPQDILNKLAQLTKLQFETIEWEKKKRFTKKKPISNAFIQSKDTP